uniref:Mucin 2, oligomeric mucus/gel-forming n=1 Tax=Corvus moneduloides TaxID=1196302 RepID=A0A8U7M631_CORMO
FGLPVVNCLLHFFSSLFLFHHLTGRTRNHGHYVCSTWGNNHFKTFDGDVYQFPGICEYNFVSDCREAYREFSVHIQRALNSNGHPEIQYILMKIKDIMVYLKPNLVVVDGRIVKTPYYSSGVLIESGEIYTKIYAKLGMVLMWNQQDALMVELDNKFNNHTCGLCGDYNGIPIYNEFIDGDVSYNSITYGNLQKISKPNAKCEDPDETQALPSCNKHRDECQRLLTSPAFADCRLRLNLEMYIQACMQDMCACNGKEDSFCLCSTISEYSRQCSHAGGRPGEWRTQNFCPKTCPATMVYRESSSPCMDTCSHLEISSLCEEHYMDGCFCPEGTVYDDISEKGCIPVSQCHCKLGGKTYAPGESISKECEECTCNSGRWTCKDLPCPGICSVEGGSHITTFDGKKYTFHGDCYYVLAKGTAKESYGLLAELAPCGSTDKQTCLKTVVLLVDNKKNVVVFRSDGSVLLNEMTVNVPHVSASFSIFKPSSNYFVVQTSFGLQMQIQLFRVMQLFVTVDQSVKGKLQGLCGNFNGMEGDDFRTTSGLIEATGSAFANTWKAQSTCTDQAEKLEDPCSLSIESANYAEHWCSLLRNPKGPFARCHLVIDPTEYYKKCKYDTCLCEDNEECLCAALSSYSRACAFKGIILGGWRKSVCSKYEASSCPGNQVFLYNLTKCQQTCRSLADGEKYCLQDFAPVDGCGCPPNTYLDNQDECVPISQCPCYYKGSYLEPGQYFTKDGERWYVLFWLFVCGEKALKKNCLLGARCLAFFTYFDCNASSKWTSQTPVQLSCHTPQIDHTECVSGCVCPQGLFDDGRGGCVEQKNCPCSHNNDWYSSGEKIKVDCNTCTCQKGTWKCTDNVCYGTCMIYGSGHYNTFDGKFYDFDGSCEYVATQDFCGDKNSSGSFSIITENVPCGTTGVTCSKAIKMFLGKTELKLENKDYKEIQRDVGDDVQYWNRTVGLYLVIEASNGVMLIWDKKTTVFIKLSPDYKGKVCGLCGNFDDKANNDFTTRSGLQESNPLEFGNSWKQSPMCPDVTEEIKPCDLKPHRKSWAEKECSIIQSEVFKICHSKVNPLPFYEACVHDACSCDSGGDCECFCSAVAAYAQECIKAEACVFWRTPDICPIFCDYYNPRNECDWHYEPCGSNITTCRMINNVSTNFTIPLLEGCYPRCPMDKPIYNEETKECVTEDECGCYIEGGIHIPPGQEVPTKENWCPCVINGTSYEVGAVVGQVQDGDMCITYICAENGSVVPGGVYPCPTSSPTTISTSFPSSTLTTTTTITTTTAPPVYVLVPWIVTSDLSVSNCPSCCDCIWTDWIDVSYPDSSDRNSGDYETFENILKNDPSWVCAKAENISCRAEKFPNTSIADLGQKVECNVNVGLICNNKDQQIGGIIPMPVCLNYEISICCTPNKPECLPTPSTTSTSTSTPSSTTSAVSSTTISTTAPTPTAEETPSSTTPTTPTTTTTTPMFVSVSSLLLSFQTQEGDSWWLCECIKAICVEDNVVQVIPVICNPPPKPTCANGLSPVPVIDEDGCCWHWECDCYCTGWGDPHYMTFDGLYYSFQGNCTYVLVEEINKKVDNFGVYIDNYYCDARDVVSCPRTLIVRHETQEVRLRTAQPNTLQVEVTVNNQLVALPYKKFGVSIYESGINRVVEIPELKMNVTYNGLSFSIRMPYSLFGNNTQGQCGTCNNNTADDCMLPDGNIAENCEIMADHWQVVDPSKPQCSPGLVPTGSPSTTPTQPCKESSICELLLGSVFEPCHALVQPDKYYAACVFDSCVLPNLDLECSSLQIYAATCADQGACIDWRKHTNGVCCKYLAILLEMLRKITGQNDTSTKQAEGCFCPNGTMLYDSGVDVCVKTCGEFYCFPWMYVCFLFFGERFTMDCQDCICLEGEHGIVCEPHECDQKKVTCDGEGFYEIQEVNPKDPCCPLFTCKCNTSFCTAKAPKCSLGFEVHSYIPSGQCCPVYQCGKSLGNTLQLLPNSSVFVDKCQNCFCTNDVNISTQLNIISCEHVPCNTYCQPGYELKPVKGECCGKCVQTKCIIHTADNSELILSPGDFKNDPRNNCTIYSCVDVHNQLIASTSEITCPAFNEESCKPGTISFLPNGCCKTCNSVPAFTLSCWLLAQSNVAIFGVNRYSAEANSMDHSCSCCRETSTTEKHVVLKCPGGHSMSHKYIYVESCSCQDTECRNPKLNELQNNEENDKASTLNRIKRAISLTSK